MPDWTHDLELLIQSAPPNDPAVSEALVREYYGYLHRLAYSILGDRLEADDAAQVSLLRALQNLGKYQSGASLKGWLSTIVINVARDLLRRRAARRRLENLLGWSGIWPQKEEPPEHAYLKNEASTALWQAVASLDEKHRLPVVLRFVHGMPVSEIAAALRVSEGTVHSRLHYAVRKLQVRLDEAPNLAAPHPKRGG